MSISSLANASLLRTTRASLRYPWRFLLAALVLLVVSVWLTTGLEVRSSFEELLPSDVPSAANAKELVRRVGGDGNVFVNIEALDGAKGLPAAQALAPQAHGGLPGHGPPIRSARWSRRSSPPATTSPTTGRSSPPPPTWRRPSKPSTAASRRTAPSALHLDDDAKKPAPALEQDAPWLDPKQPLPRQKIEEGFARYKDGFLVHPDGASLTLVVRPAGTSLGVAEASKLLERLRKVVDGHRAELDASRLRVGFAGSFPMFVATTQAIVGDVLSTIALVVSLVLVSLFLFFRDVRSTVSLGIACVCAVLVTFGITRLVIGYLNTQTAFLGSIVIGNGINYGSSTWPGCGSSGAPGWRSSRRASTRRRWRRTPPSWPRRRPASRSACSSSRPTAGSGTSASSAASACCSAGCSPSRWSPRSSRSASASVL